MSSTYSMLPAGKVFHRFNWFCSFLSIIILIRVDISGGSWALNVRQNCLSLSSQQSEMFPTLRIKCDKELICSHRHHHQRRRQCCTPEKLFIPSSPKEIKFLFMSYNHVVSHLWLQERQQMASIHSKMSTKSIFPRCTWKWS